MYQLNVSEKQAEVLCKALDLYSRIGIGQFEEVVNIFTWTADKRIENSDLDSSRMTCDALKKLMFDLPSNASYGIHNQEVPDRYRVAWDVQQVIRHQIWKDKPEKTRFTVDAYEPSQSSTEPLPTINKTSVVKLIPGNVYLFQDGSQYTFRDVKKGEPIFHSPHENNDFPFCDWAYTVVKDLGPQED